MKTIILFLFLTVSLNAQLLLQFSGETATPDPYGAELVVNGDMELNSDWGNSGTPTTNEQSLTQTHGGTYSWHVACDGGNEGTINTAAFSVTSGVTYHITAWVYLVSGRAYMHRNAGRLNFSVQLTTTTTGAWQLLTVDIEASSTGLETLKFLSVNAGGDEFYVDDVSVKEVL